MSCNPKKSIESPEGDLWCKFCWNRQLHSEDEPVTRPCHKCGLVHFADSTIEKVDGYYCGPCATVYEKELLTQLTV